jgi:hypothetical protein
MLVQFSKVEELLCKTVGLALCLVIQRLQLGVLILNLGQLVTQVGYAIVVHLIVIVTDEVTVRASEDDSRTSILMLEQVLVRTYFLASLVTVTTLEPYLT